MLVWQQGIPANISRYQNCSDKGGLSFIDAISHDSAKNHFIIGGLFCFLAYYRFCACASQFIKFRSGACEWTGWDFFTPIPIVGKYLLPWKLSWEIIWKICQPSLGYYWLIYSLTPQGSHGVSPVTDYRFNGLYEKSFEIVLGVGSSMLLSAAVDLIYYNSRPRLLPDYSPHLAFGLAFQVNGLLFITHATWMESLMQMFMHLVAVLFYLGTAAALYLTAAFPHSFLLLTAQCLGLACLGVHFLAIGAYYTAWGMFDASHDPTDPCREWMIVMSSFENMEIIWLGINYIVIFNASVLTAIFVSLALYYRKKGFRGESDSNVTTYLSVPALGFVDDEEPLIEKI